MPPTTAAISSSVFGRTTASARCCSSWRFSTGLNQLKSWLRRATRPSVIHSSAASAASTRGCARPRRRDRANGGHAHHASRIASTSACASRRSCSRSRPAMRSFSTTTRPSTSSARNAGRAPLTTGRWRCRADRRSAGRGPGRRPRSPPPCRPRACRRRPGRAVTRRRRCRCAPRLPPSSRPRRRPARVASRRGPARGSARCSSQQACASLSMSAASFDAAPSTASATGAPAASSSGTRAMPLPSRALLCGQCAMPVPLVGAERDLVVVQVHHVRVPDVVADPLVLGDELHRRAAVQLARPGHVVVRLGQVAVQPDAEAPRLARQRLQVRRACSSSWAW